MKQALNQTLFSRFPLAAPLVTALALGLSTLPGYSDDNLWTGASSPDWNDAANWSLGGVPDAEFGDNAVVSIDSPNIATITEDILFTPNDIIVSGGGRIDHLAGVAGTFGGSWMFVGQDSTLSVYNLADTSTPAGGISGYGQGSGTVEATGNFNLAAFGGNRVGTMNMNTTGALNVTGAFRIGNDGGSVGIMNLESGAVIVANDGAIYAGTENDIGHGGGVATLNISGGSLSVSDVLRLGNASGSGTLNMTGGTITKTGNGQFLVGQNLGTGSVLHSAGTIGVNNEMYIGNANAGSGNYTLDGTGSLTVANELIVGRELGTGTLNVDGGTITTEGNGNMYVGRRNGTGTLNQTAGTIEVNAEFGVGTRDGDQGGIGSYILSGGTLAATNSIFIGKEAASSGTMTMSGGTVTGRDKLIVGDNGASGLLTQSGGTVEVQNEIYVGNGPAPAPGTAILSNANDGQLEKRSSAPETVTIQNIDSWNVSIGEWYGNDGLTTAVIPFQLPDFGAVANPFTTATFGVNLYNKGDATVTDLDLYAVRVSASPQIATTDWYNGSVPDPNATLLQAGFLTPASTTASVGPESGPNNLTDEAGSAALLAYLNAAYDGGNGAGQFVFLRVSYASDSFPSGWDAYQFTTRNAALEGDAPVINFTSAVAPLPPDATYTVSGSAVVNVGNEVIVGREDATGTFNLDGGTVNASKISGGTGTSTANFNGGILRAKRDEGNLIENLDVANVASGGLKIDSNGFSVATSQFLTGAGGLEKSGAGQLTLSGPNTYAGTTTVTAGVLRIEKTGLNAIVDADANTLVAEFAAQPAPGNYAILPGPLAGAQDFVATGLGSQQQATFLNATSMVTVTGEPDGDPYVAWIDSFTPNPLLPDEASKQPAADPDGDGIANLMEYVLAGGDPVVPSLAILPTVAVQGDNLVLSYTRNDESEADTTQVGQWTTDLTTTWTDVAPVLVNENGAAADDMTVTVPLSSAVNGKLFLRLKVSMP